MTAPVAPPALETPVAPPQPRPCPSCGSTNVAEYCARCGELQPAHRDLTIRGTIYDAAQDFFGIDGRVPRTLWALITKPGLLTREFIEGRRGRFAKPLSLFLVLNLVFFAIQPHTGLFRYGLSDFVGAADDPSDTRNAILVQQKLERTHESRESYERRYDATLSNQKKSMLLVAVPILALALALLFGGTKRYFVEHLAFSVHAYAFFLILLTLGVPVAFYTIGGWLSIFALAGVPVWGVARLLNGEAPLVIMIMTAMTTYLTLAIRRAYGGTVWVSLLRAFFLTFIQMVLIWVFRTVLFYSAYLST